MKHGETLQSEYATTHMCDMQIVQSLVLIDAVCLLTCWPGLLQNFIYALPTCELNGKGCLDMIRYICSRDMMIAEVCCSLVP